MSKANGRDARQPKVTPKICDGVPITGAQNLNKLFKGLRQDRMKARGFPWPHTVNRLIEFFRRNGR